MARVKKGENNKNESVKSAEEQTQLLTIVVKAPFVNIRKKADSDCEILRVVSENTKLITDSGINGYFHLVNGGFIKSEFCEVLVINE